MSWRSLTDAFIWILGVFLGVVWLSRMAIVWMNRKSVADISTPEYSAPPKTPTPPKEGGMGHPLL